MVRKFVGVLAFAALAWSAQGAALLFAPDGTVMGATGVVIADDGPLGHYYDVEFADGTCEVVFSGCTEFAFPTANKAQAAGFAFAAVLEALLASEHDIRGCSQVTKFCTLATPVMFRVDGSLLTLGAVRIDSDSVGCCGQAIVGGPVLSTSDLTSSIVSTWSRWTRGPRVDSWAPEAGFTLIACLLTALSRRREFRKRPAVC